MITQEMLKMKLKYEPLTGGFEWICASKYSSNLNGRIAGTLNRNGYMQIGLNRKYYLSHRLAFLYMTGFMPIYEVDHIDHIKTNNEWGNLRLVSRIENSKNQPLHKRNKTGVVGVKYRANQNRYIARISVDKKDVYLGSYINFDDAVLVRKNAEVKYGFHVNHGV